jgi:phospholipase/carboxylesterase
LTDDLQVRDLAVFAPSANGGTWYPQRFFVPTGENEPWLSSGLAVVDQLVEEAVSAGRKTKDVALIGFSQGGCLALEYAARWPRRYAFVAGLSAALIGPLDTTRRPGDLEGTPVLLGCSTGDPHIPLEFVNKSAETLERFNAKITKQIYPGAAHTVFPQEIDWINRQLQ